MNTNSRMLHRSRLRHFWVLMLIVAVTGCQSSQTPETSAVGQSLPDLDPAAITQGKLVYDTYCAECHGLALEGEAGWRQQNEDDSFRAPPHDATGHTWHHSDRLLIESIMLGGQRFSADIGGTSPMPAFAEVLSEAEIRAVLIFIKSHWPDDIRQSQWQVSQMNNQ